MDVLRTPDERFTDLPGFPFAPRYAETSDGLRIWPEKLTEARRGRLQFQRPS